MSYAAGFFSSIDRKVAKRVRDTYGSTIPIDPKLQTYYMEFSELWEPMHDPAHIYCGRNEFAKRSRIDCTSSCQWK